LRHRSGERPGEVALGRQRDRPVEQVESTPLGVRIVG
jgi:hypothetical protein